MVQAGHFPRPVCITERNRGYLLESVEAWMTARAEGRPFDTGTTGTLQTHTAARINEAYATQSTDVDTERAFRTRSDRE